MSPYEYKYERQFQGFRVGDPLITAKRLVAGLVDSQWNHSWHWPEEVDANYVAKVIDSISSELEIANKRINELRRAEKIVKSINLGE